MKKEKKVYALLVIVAGILFAFEFKSENSSSNVFRDLKTGNVESLAINTTANVYFQKAEEFTFQLEGDKDIVDNLEVLQIGNQLVIQMKKIYNPFKLLRLAYESSKPVNVYISGPNANQMKIQNRNYFATSHLYENGGMKMLILKSPRLFSNINLRSATCSALKTSNLM